MNDTERNEMEQRLLRERERTVRALDRVDEDARISTEDDGDLTQYRQHPADDGTDTIDQEQAMVLLGKESELLTQIDEALRRLYKEPETFGKCEQCGREIRKERLELVPWARLCAEHAKEEEAGG